MSNSSNQTTNKDKIKSLEDIKPLISMKKVGNLYVSTIHQIEVDLTRMLQATGIDALDSILIAPRLTNDMIGADNMICKAYFIPNTGSCVYYKSGGGRGSVDKGTFTLINVAGGTGIGPFNFTPKFTSTIGPLCPDDLNSDDQNKVIIDLKKQNIDGQTVAVLELDMRKVLFFILGIPIDEKYDCRILKVEPAGKDNYQLLVSVFESSEGIAKGKRSGINYKNVHRTEMRNLNGNRDFGGRQY